MNLFCCKQLLLNAVLADVICISYEYESATLKGLLNQLNHVLQGRSARYCFSFVIELKLSIFTSSRVEVLNYWCVACEGAWEYLLTRKSPEKFVWCWENCWSLKH